MSSGFWFNRMVQYWSLPVHIDLADLTRQAHLQLVQAGTFGPMFYGLADDEEVDRHWAGMPLVGIEANLNLAANTIAAVQEGGGRFVGQMSMSWNYGDHEKGKGLFGVWERIWTDGLLGTPPCGSAEDVMEREADGSLRCWKIEGRPYYAYSGCFCNPLWVALLKAMVSGALRLGVDGLMVHHNFSTFCACSHCREYLLPLLCERFKRDELRSLYGITDLGQWPDLRSPRPDAPVELRSALRFEVERWTHRRRKEIFDEVVIGHGRAAKPDLLAAQWYHKYDFGPRDERSLLPADLWARNESYVWYSQGAHKGESHLRQGYLADTGLASRFTYAAGAGRPFVTNKYDYHRLKLSIAEAAANGGAALAFHFPQDPDPADRLGQAEYVAAVVRYHAFLARHAALYHPAKPWAQVALVYPRRGELWGEGDCLDSLHRAGRALEDGHVLFDIILDEQVAECCSSYRTLVIPRPGTQTREEWDRLRQFVAQGGILVLLQGFQKSGGHFPLGEWPSELRRRVHHLGASPWTVERREVRPGVHLPVWPPPDEDQFGVALRTCLSASGGSMLQTDAPWFVRVRAWRPQESFCLALHWVNYRQVETAVVETPWPVGPLSADCAVPTGECVTGVSWHAPEAAEASELAHTEAGGRVVFQIPQLVTYGISVVHTDASSGDHLPGDRSGQGAL